ncbi:MAG: 3-dehydroquinate synthase [Clostridia bacterium]|nr:3-dehydroquinate synthase [Clostridia bacterium]
MSQVITVKGVSKPYDCIIGSGVISLLREKIKDVTKAKKILVVTDDNVDLLYGNRITELLTEGGFVCCKYVFSNGEENKNMETVTNILEFAMENQISRSDCIIALGGGIVGDVAGFCASICLRGIDFIQIPTTFLAAIDSSVGGKTGVNLRGGKNLAGAFYQPKLVICDTDFLNTLSPEIFSDGTAEAIKYGVIFDKSLFEKLRKDFSDDIENIISRCIYLKAQVVSQDEFDTGRRQLLNFGHTIGHAIEKCSNFTISHGRAVAIGMVMASRGAYKMGYTDKDNSIEIAKILNNNNLPVSSSFDIENLLDVMVRDKKRQGEEITLVIPEKIGKCVLKTIPVNSLKEFLKCAL